MCLSEKESFDGYLLQSYSFSKRHWKCFKTHQIDDRFYGWMYIHILTEEKRAFVSYRKSKLSSETCLDFKGRIYITYLVLLKQLF